MLQEVRLYAGVPPVVAFGATTGSPIVINTATAIAYFLGPGDVVTPITIVGGAGLNQLTGDVTAGPGTGSQVATIPNDTVTYAKMQNVTAASKLLGRGDSGSGDPQEITLGTNLTMTGTTLDAAGGSGITQGFLVWYTGGPIFP